MNHEQRRYLAFMLRLWQVDDSGRSVWRASLESPHTGERLGFASLDLLFAFLQENTKENLGFNGPIEVDRAQPAGGPGRPDAM